LQPTGASKPVWKPPVSPIFGQVSGKAPQVTQVQLTWTNHRGTQVS
jgi:hypothetical protein